MAHLRWWHGFAGQFWQGDLYPRWLHGINHGLGSPAFFYYPPMPYWASALFAPIAGDAMPGWRALGWASALALVLSGLAALACFRKMAPGRGALVCALAYMVMPYHLAIDLLERGAYAEFWSFVWMPLALRGLLGLRDGEECGFLIMAAGFGGLFLTHLPTAVTFTPVALACALGLDAARFISARHEGQGRGGSVATIRIAGRMTCLAVGAVVLGAGLAAVYLVPALTTQRAVVIETMHRPYEYSLFFPHWDWSEPILVRDGFNTRVLLAFLGLVLVMACGYVGCFVHHEDAQYRTQRVVWVAAGFGVMMMMLPVSMWLYEALQPLRMIQFVWRFMAPGTLIGAALLAVFWPRTNDPKVWRLAHGLALVVTVALSVGLTWRAYRETCLSTEMQWGQIPATVDVTGRDVPEYFPRKAGLVAARELMGGEKVKVSAGEARVNVRQWRARRIELDVQSAGGAQLLLRQFYYPGWTARDAMGAPLSLMAESSSGILQLGVPGGSQRVTVLLQAGLAEKVGWTLTLFSLAGIAGWWWAARNQCSRHATQAGAPAPVIHEATT